MSLKPTNYSSRGVVKDPIDPVEVMARVAIGDWIFVLKKVVRSIGAGKRKPRYKLTARSSKSPTMWVVVIGPMWALPLIDAAERNSERFPVAARLLIAGKKEDAREVLLGARTEHAGHFYAPLESAYFGEFKEIRTRTTS